MPIDVLIAGDANLDLVLTGDTVPRFGQAEQLLGRADLVLGSSAGICAAGLSRLDVSCAVVARVGDDRLGREFRESLKSAGVESGALVVDPEEGTGLSVHLINGDDRAILTHRGAMTRLTARDVEDAVERLSPRHVHVAGLYLLPGLLPELAGLTERLRRRGITVSVDPNDDPSGRWAHAAQWSRNCDILLPNDAELDAIAARVGVAATDSRDRAVELSRRGPRVVVKAGSAGGFVALSGELLTRHALAIEVVDTVGAGDSFDAGYLAAWLRGEDSATCLAWACVAGALSVRAAGGTAGQPTLAELLARV